MAKTNDDLLSALLHEVENDCGNGADTYSERVMQARAAVLARMTAGWQPIATAPRDGTRIDLWAKGRRWANATYEKPGEVMDWPRWNVNDPTDRTCWLPVNPKHYDAPTHWMPRPSKPTPADPRP